MESEDEYEIEVVVRLERCEIDVGGEKSGVDRARVGSGWRVGVRENGDVEGCDVDCVWNPGDGRRTEEDK